MTDAACLSLIFDLLVFIGSVIFYVTIHRAAKAIVILSCKGDHGHGKPHLLPCDCACHRAEAQ